MNNNYQIYNERYKNYLDWNKYSITVMWHKYLMNKILKKVDKYKINNILDIGCGDGLKANLLLNYFKNSKVLGIDFTDEGIKFANEYYSNSNLEFKKLNVMDIDEKEEKYDLVTSFEVLEHIEDWEALLKKMADISNRYILISVPTGRMRDYEVHLGHLRNFKKGQLEEFLNNNGFETVKTFYAGFPFYSPLGRDWLNKNYNEYNESISGTFTIKQKILYTSIYILFRYFCFNNIGDQFFGLFKKINITVNSNGGGGKL